jgi:hypothetical protein
VVNNSYMSARGLTLYTSNTLIGDARAVVLGLSTPPS